jgi:hypothetical protein
MTKLTFPFTEEKIRARQVVMGRSFPVWRPLARRRRACQQSSSAVNSPHERE